MSACDCAILMIPADGNFETSISYSSYFTGQFIGGCRHHASLLNSLGVKKLAVIINKMDFSHLPFSKSRFEEIKKETKIMLVKCGWKSDFVEHKVPIIPISAY